MKRDYLYHYTSIIALKKILIDKTLKTSNNGEKVDSLWFSSNPVWEPTATKMVLEKGGFMERTKEEQHESIGLARIAVKNSILFTSWDKYLQKAGIPLRESKCIETLGNKKQWFCRLKNIPSAMWEKIEIWDGAKWIPYTSGYVDSHFPDGDCGEYVKMSLEEVFQYLDN